MYSKVPSGNKENSLTNELCNSFVGKKQNVNYYRNEEERSKTCRSKRHQSDSNNQDQGEGISRLF